MAETVIDVKELTKHYPSAKAVDGIDFEVRSGTVFSLLGPNGAGKTTTVEILEGLRTPTAGTAAGPGPRTPAAGEGAGPRPRHREGLPRNPGPRRRAPPGVRAVRPPHAVRGRRVLGAALQSRPVEGGREAAPSGRLGHGAGEHPGPQALRRGGAEARDRDVPRRRAGAAVPRRAHDGVGPEGPAGPLGPDPAHSARGWPGLPYDAIPP